MCKYFLIVFFYSLCTCFMVSSSYFQFDRVVQDFVSSLNEHKTLNFYTQPLRYVNWIIPMLAPILISYIRPFRFNLHQGLIYNLICLFFMNIVFHVFEFIVLSDSTLNMNFVLLKVWLLQMIHTTVLSIIYWINLISLISDFEKNDVLLLASCYILTTIFGNYNFNLTFKSYYTIFQLATIGFLLLYYVLTRFRIDFKDDFKPLPLMSFKNHVLKKPIVLTSFFESFFIGGILFLHFLPYFALFLLTFVPTAKRSQITPELYYHRLRTLTYFPFFVGLTFAVFFLATFASIGVKKTVWSMTAKNMLFIYVWSLLFEFKIPYYYFNNILNGLLFFAISVNVLIQAIAVIENFKSSSHLEPQSICLFTPCVLFSGLILSWLTLTITLGLKIYYFDCDFSEKQTHYLYASFLIGLFICAFNHILRDEYVDTTSSSSVRIGEPAFV